MENIPTVKGLTENLSNDITKLEETLEPLLDIRSMEQKFDSPNDRAKYYTSLAYTLTSLLFAYFKSTGKDTSHHEIMKELDRVKSYMSKVKETVDGREKPRVSVNKAVADRFIKSALAGNKDNNYLQKMAENSSTHKRFDEENDDNKKNTKKRSSEQEEEKDDDSSDIQEISPQPPKKTSKKSKSKSKKSKKQ